MTAAPLAAASTLCQRCGISGRHATPLECIDALRDRIAVLSFKRDTPDAAPVKECPRGGRRDRKDSKWVVLDGERMILPDAARRLGISNVALHFRLVNRTGGPDYDGVDVRAVGADRKHTPTECSRLAHAAKAQIHAVE